MDFVGDLPPTACNFNAIAVFVNKLTKLAHFVPSTIAASAVDVAHQFFFGNIFFFKLHGLFQRLSRQTATIESLAGSGRSCTSYWMRS